MLTLIRRQFSPIREQLQTLLSGRARVEQDRDGACVTGGPVQRISHGRRELRATLRRGLNRSGLPEPGPRRFSGAKIPKKRERVIATALAADHEGSGNAGRASCDIAKIDAASFMQGRTLV